MPVFNPYEDIIVPVGEALQTDARFFACKIFYDRTRDRIVPADLMPAINYFLEGPWDDLARGSGSSSLQRRTHTARLGFGVWVCATRDPAYMDSVLFQISGDLLDYFWENRLFNRTKGVCIKDTIRWDIDYSGNESTLIGTQKLSVEFEIIGGG